MKMVVKSKMGRRRYIVFEIQEGKDITMKDLIFTFNRSLPLLPPAKTDNEIQSENDGDGFTQDNKRPVDTGEENSEYPVLKHRLKYFDGTHGILLCPHWLKPKAIEIINSVQYVGYLKKPVKIQSVGISGTLKKARKKYLP
jgi:RNase P/RNase MRP subunit POP5